MAQREWSNDEWLTALQADREVAWATLRERVLRGLVAYLRGSRPAGLAADEARDEAVQVDAFDPEAFRCLRR